MYNKFLFVPILFITCCFGMQHPEDSTMTKINEWHEMAQFAGQIIAYQTNSPYMFSKDNYIIDNNSSIIFGQVSSDTVGLTNEEGERYYLSRVIKKDSIGSYAAVTKKVVLEGLWVRRATQEEIEKIKSAVVNEQARWY